MDGGVHEPPHIWTNEWSTMGGGGGLQTPSFQCLFFLVLLICIYFVHRFPVSVCSRLVYICLCFTQVSSVCVFPAGQEIDVRWRWMSVSYRAPVRMVGHVLTPPDHTAVSVPHFGLVRTVTMTSLSVQVVLVSIMPHV